MKKIALYVSLALTGLFTVACSEDFKEWTPQTTYEAASAVTIPGFTASAIGGTVDLNDSGDAVQLLTLSEAALPEGYSIKRIRMDVLPENAADDATPVLIEADDNGAFPKAELQQVIKEAYGVKPVSRTLVAHVYATATSAEGEGNYLDCGTIQLSLVPEAPEIEMAYYLTGSINNWDNADKTYKMTNDGTDPYDNPSFFVRIPAPEVGTTIEFKMTPESGLGGDWSQCLAANGDGKFNYNNDGGNFSIKVEALKDEENDTEQAPVFYDLTFDMLAQTWQYKALYLNIEQAYYLTGTINGWNNSDTTYKLTNDGRDPYENPIFTLRIPASEDGSDIAFKMTPESGLGGNWSGCLAAGAGEGTFVYNNGGGDLVLKAVEGAKYYDLTFNMMELTWSYRAIAFEPFVYFIGATDGWNNNEQNRQRVSAIDDGVYTGYIYIADPNGWGVEFKFQKVLGSWDNADQLNSNNMVEVNGDFQKGGDNFVAAAGEGVYFVELDLNTNVMKGTFVKNMNLVGDFNGWNAADDAQQMTWNANDYCWEISNAGVNANGWKFTINDAWTVNLGSNDSTEPSTVITDLVANGKNIGAVGTTIKLYPTRRLSDKIYCTVE